MSNTGHDTPQAMVSNSSVLSLNPTLVEADPSREAVELLERAQAGDVGAYGEVCRLYEDRLLRQAMVLCRNATLAEDLAQDTLVEGWRCLRRYDGRRPFFPWLCAILFHRYGNTLREKRPVPFSVLAEAEHPGALDRIGQASAPEARPDEAAQRHEEAELVQQCVGKLPAKHRAVIYLRFYVEESLEGIAAALGCSVGTVKSRLFHAMDKLRRMEALKGRGGER